METFTTAVAQWWQAHAEAIAVVELGLLVMGSIWTFLYRRSLSGKMDALVEQQSESSSRAERQHQEYVDLSSAFARLPQSDLGDGHRCGELPPGANLVRLADGSFRIALPQRASVTIPIGPTSAEVGARILPASDEPDP